MKPLPPDVSAAIEDLLAKGTRQVDIAKMLDVSPDTIAARAAAKRAESGVDLQAGPVRPRQLVSDERMAEMYRRAGRNYAGRFVMRGAA